MSIQAKLDQIESVKLAIENGEYTETDLVAFIESFRPTFTALGAVSQSNTIRTELNKLIEYAGKYNLISKYHTSQLTQNLNSIYTSAINITSKNNKTIG